MARQVTDDGKFSDFDEASRAFSLSLFNGTANEREKLEGKLASQFNTLVRTHDQQGGLIVAQSRTIKMVSTLVNGLFGYTMDRVSIYLEGNAATKRHLLIDNNKVHLLAARPIAPN